jgi:hypothetical protein
MICRAIHFAAVVVAFGLGSAQAAQWKVMLTEIAVEPTKETGQPWDGDNSAPDIVGKFAVGVVDGQECKVGEAKAISKQQDTYRATLNIQTIGEAESASDLCVKARIADKDLMEDDLIGAGVARLKDGMQDLKVGQATLSIKVIGVGAATPAAVAVDLPAPPAPHPNGMYRVSIVSATIATTKPDGSTWDPADDPEAENGAFVGGLAKLGLKLALGGPAAALLGSAMNAGGNQRERKASHAAQTRAAPDTKVTMQWGDLAFETPVHRNTYAPTWSTQFLVPKETFESTSARVSLADDDDGSDDQIGTDLVKAKQLLVDDIVRLKVGSAGELIVHVERVTESVAPLEKSVSIKGEKMWVDTGLTVFGGQTVHVNGTGETCIRGGSECFSAGGDPATFIKAGEVSIHLGQLAAVVGNDIYPIGAARAFFVKSGGRLSVGIARGSVSAGGLDATVRVFYPVTVASAVTPSMAH